MATVLRQPRNRIGAPPMLPQAASVKPLVLVAEDHEDTRFMLMYLLERQGCRVAMAGDGETAVWMAEMMCPDLILMDANLPHLDGLAATRRIRKTLAHVPVVFLSGYAEASFRAAALETGGNDYLVKPFEIKQLESVVTRHLEKTAQQKFSPNAS